ncbi:MAG: 50S ribosomal protein L11 methyltransferase [Clostridiales Family XIII bacterium]|jgi:ribosomal protein L11 methyltransferase|nr:50S ribosomal protein L11 methyltransferase [Clostridiales Family XIII bacterium]
MNETYLKVTIHTTTQGAEALAPVLERCGVTSFSVEDSADLDFVIGSAAGAVWDFVDPALEADTGAAVRVSFYLPETDVGVHAGSDRDGYLNIGSSRDGYLDADCGGDADTLRSVPLAVADLQREVMQGAYGPEADFGPLSIETELICDDWVERSRAAFHTFSPAKGIVIRPPWEDWAGEAAGDEAETVIVIDPGMAFGTGSHETTSMCLTALAEAIDRRRAAAPGDGTLRVLDVGTGSGILAIYAALRGAKRVVAVEIDPDAAASARGNLKINGVEDHIELIVGDVCQAGVLPDGEEYDLILANLTCRLLAALLPALRLRLAPGGMFILSGLLDAQEEAIREALAASGLEVLTIFRMGEWLAVLAGEGFPPSRE